MKKANRLHVLAMNHLFCHVLATEEKGPVIEPSSFEITGMSDANYGKYPDVPSNVNSQF